MGHLLLTAFLFIILFIYSFRFTLAKSDILGYMSFF